MAIAIMMLALASGTTAAGFVLASGASFWLVLLAFIGVGNAACGAVVLAAIFKGPRQFPPHAQTVRALSAAH